MEVQNVQNDENEKALEASVVENDKASCKNEEVLVEPEENDKNEVTDTSAGQKSKADDKLVETSVDANGTVEEPSVLASVEACSSGIKKPQGLPAKTRIVKKVKKLVKRKIKKGTAVQVAGKENDTLIQDIDEGRTVVNIKEDEQSAKPSLGESKKEIKKVIDSVAGSPQCSSSKDKDSETSLGGNDMEVEELAEAPQPTDADEKVVGGEPSGKETLKEVKGQASILKRKKGKKVKGILAEVMDKKSATVLQGPKEGVEIDLIVSDKRDAGVSSEGKATEAEKAIGSSVKASENALLVEKKQPRKRKLKAKLKKIPPAQLVISEVDKGTPQLEQNDHDNNNVLDGNRQCSDAEKVISLEANTGEGSQQKTLTIKRKQTEDKTGLAGDQRIKKKKRQRKQVTSFHGQEGIGKAPPSSNVSFAAPVLGSSLPKISVQNHDSINHSSASVPTVVSPVIPTVSKHPPSENNLSKTDSIQLQNSSPPSGDIAKQAVVKPSWKDCVQGPSKKLSKKGDPF